MGKAPSDLRPDSQSLTRSIVMHASTGVRHVSIDGETIIVHIHQMKTYRLNETATFIWLHTEDPTSMEIIIQAFAKNFNLPPVKAREWVLNLVKELLVLDLLSEVRVVM